MIKSTIKSLGMSGYITLFLTIIISGYTYLGDEYTIILASGPLAVILCLYLMYMVNKSGLNSRSWVILRIALISKTAYWVIISAKWYGIEHGEHIWPSTDNTYYILDFIGSSFAIYFTTRIVKIDSLSAFRYNIIFDTLLIYFSIIILFLIFYHDTLLKYIGSVNSENFIIRLQVFPAAWVLLFASIVITTTTTSSSFYKKMISLCGFVFYCSHLFMESYFTFSSPARENYHSYAMISRTFSDIGMINLVITIHYCINNRISESNCINLIPKKGMDRLPSLIWFSSILTITVVTIPIFRFFLDQKNNFFILYTFFSITVVLVVILRLILLIKNVLKNKQSLEEAANIDQLTNILNRRGFIQTFEEHRDFYDITYPFLFGLIDINHFKVINDSYGHDTGDAVLVKLAALLNENEHIQIVGRLGGDEFVILLNLNKNSPAHSAKKLHDDISFTLLINKSMIEEISVHVSLGIVVVEEAFNFNELYHYADEALYIAKENFSHIHIRSLASNGTTEGITNIINLAITSNNIELHYQPIFNLKTNKLVLVEVLIRLKDENNVIIPPREFIQIAKDNNRMLPLTFNLIDQLAENQKITPEINYSINLDPMLIEDQNSFEKVVQRMTESGLSNKKTVLEITEHGSKNRHFLKKNTLRLRELGYLVALDDYSYNDLCFNRLVDIKFDIIKFDISLLKEAERGNPLPLESISLLCQRLDMLTIVVGVENEKHLETIAHCNIDMAQGFYYSKPLPHKAFILQFGALANSSPLKRLHASA